MNIRTEIEKLLYWYVPAYIISAIVAFVLISYNKYLDDPGILAAYVIVPLGILMKHLDSVVIMIWLYFLAKQLKQNYKLWALFGLIAHIFAAALFIALYVYEKANPNETDESEGIKPKRKLFIWSK
jgi:hypothetical protein